MQLQVVLKFDMSLYGEWNGVEINYLLNVEKIIYVKIDDIVRTAHSAFARLAPIVKLL